jgi:ABC-type branched-subunit amino acid transport system ATPase component
MKLKKTYKHPEAGDYFTFETDEKIVVLIGPNGAGKTTMLDSFKQQMEENYNIIYDNPQEIDGNVSHDAMFDPKHVSHRWTSEGERMSYTLGNTLRRVGESVRNNKPTVVLFDRLDSGLSYDRIKEMADVVIEYVSKDVDFIAIAANSYELCYALKDVAKFYWVPTNEWIDLPNFEDFIEMYKLPE